MIARWPPSCAPAAWSWWSLQRARWKMWIGPQRTIILFILWKHAATTAAADSKAQSRLIMQPYTLSRCAPEAWRMPDEAEVLGKVVAVITYLNEPWTFDYGATRKGCSGWNEKAL
jgi:hypothetical protein